MIGRLNLGLILAAMSQVACNTKVSKSGDSVPYGLVVPRQYTWPNATAEVCWKTTGFEKEKSFIKATLEREFNKRTNFSFHGFSECGAFFLGKVAVELIPEIHPAMTTGYWGAIPDAKYQLFTFEFANPEFAICRKSFRLAETCMNNVVLHEFGHVAGLSHEQDRVDSECDYFKGYSWGNEIPIGPYDNGSIMNSCNPRYISEKMEIMKLSDGDIQGVNFLYPR